MPKRKIVNYLLRLKLRNPYNFLSIHNPIPSSKLKMKPSMSLIAVLLITLTYMVCPGYGSAGVKDHGDSCNIISSGVQFFDKLGGGNNNYAGACDVEKGLVCTGTCSCLPGTHYEQSFIENIFGGGRCMADSGNAGANTQPMLMLNYGLLACVVVAIERRFTAVV